MATFMVASYAKCYNYQGSRTDELSIYS